MVYNVGGLFLRHFFILLFVYHWKFPEMQCVYALILFLAIFWRREFAYTLETSTINTALLSHQWSNVCTQ